MENIESWLIGSRVDVLNTTGRHSVGKGTILHVCFAAFGYEGFIETRTHAIVQMDTSNKLMSVPITQIMMQEEAYETLS